jgi:DnaJ-class molecular chaperone
MEPAPLRPGAGVADMRDRASVEREMIIDVECPTCQGEGWIPVRYNTSLLKGVFEEDCPRCGGSGVIERDLNEEGDEE